MKKIFLFVAFSCLLFGCNMNPSKEARLQKLEAETQLLIDQISQLERSHKTLIIENKELKARITELENQ